MDQQLVAMATNDRANNRVFGKIGAPGPLLNVTQTLSAQFDPIGLQGQLRFN